MSIDRITNSDPYERFRKSGYVRWSELSQAAKERLLSAGHPSNRPQTRDIEADQCRYRQDGSGWIAGFAM